MGASISSMWRRHFGKTEMRILMLGLDAAGKTTILYKLRLGEVVTTIPTIGFNVETVEFSGKSLISFTTWDIGGRSPMRPLWRHFYQNANAVIFVIDSNDRDRIEHAQEELCSLLSEDELRDAILLVFANKQDLPNALAVDELTDKLGLNQLRNREWNIVGSCATSGQGLYEGLDWLSEALQVRKDGPKQRAKGYLVEAKVDVPKEELNKTSRPLRTFAENKMQQMKVDQDGLESVADTESTADTEAMEIDASAPA